MAGEFSLIERWLAPLADAIGDDCALFEIDSGQRLAVSVDTLVEGVHIPAGSAPNLIAFRAVVTALSDLAAMGATPRAITLALTLPVELANDTWFESFSAGLADVLGHYPIELLGGDTTAGPLTVTVQVMGTLPQRQALLRSGAAVGDLLYVSGYTGDAAAGLALVQGHLQADDKASDYLQNRFWRPLARTELGGQLLHVATSAIDISDGLLADAAHLARSSGVRLQVQPESLPLSPALQSLGDVDQALAWALSGGDDYELLFTVPPDRVNKVPSGCHCIGAVTEGTGVDCPLQLSQVGYQHFVQGAGG